MEQATETQNAADTGERGPLGSSEAPGCAGFDAVIARLDAISESLELENIHWIRGEAGPNWCYACGKSRAKHLRRRAARKDKNGYTLDGGYPAGDEDGCASCEGCGKLLRYSLTEHGVESELAHFLEHLEPHGAINQETAYELARVFEYGQDIPELAAHLNQLAEMVWRWVK